MCISSLRIYRVSATVSWAHSGLWYQTPSSRKSFLQSLWSARTHVYTFLGGGSSSRETTITCHCCREYWYNCNAIRKNCWSNVIRVACSSAKGGSIQSTLQTPLAATLFNRLYDMIPTQYTVHVSCKWSLIKEFKVFYISSHSSIMWDILIIRKKYLQTFTWLILFLEATVYPTDGIAALQETWAVVWHATKYLHIQALVGRAQLHWQLRSRYE